MTTLEKLYRVIAMKSKLDRDRDLMAEAAALIERLQDEIASLTSAQQDDA